MRMKKIKRLWRQCLCLGSKSYVFRCATQEEMAKWMAVLDLASKAEIPSGESPICKNLDQCDAELQEKLH
ncbi:Pleckstrin [Trichinella spiralis]|uniref:Pleckstrin n=1 Tax=Trichinella spiralis TaxID=6334 RepID=A0ABR3KCM4_TRISP